MKERIQQLLGTMGFTATRLADEIHVQRSGISHILSGRNQPSYDFLTRLLNRFPQIDARWLLTGQGDMFNKLTGNEEVIKVAKITEEKGKNITDSNDAIEDFNILQSENKPIFGVTNVNRTTRIILLQSDGTFELYLPGKAQ